MAGADVDGAELGPWAPLSVDEVAQLFIGASFRWYLAGGHALELAVGGSWRDHHDVDVGVRRDELAIVRDHLDGWDLHIAAAGALRPWQGGPLTAARHENNVWVRRRPGEPWCLDLLVGGGDDDHWWSRRDRAIAVPWPDALGDAGGVPYLAPHLQLLMKSKDVRPKDTIDASVVIPTLTTGQAAFLSRLLPPEHAWQRLLAAA